MLSNLHTALMHLLGYLPVEPYSHKRLVVVVVVVVLVLVLVLVVVVVVAVVASLLFYLNETRFSKSYFNNR